MWKLTVFAVTCFAVLVTGCATPNSFTEGRPVHATGGSFFSRQYVQDGKPLSLDQLFTHLTDNDAAKSKATAAQYWFYGSLVPAGVGGFLVGYNLFSSGKASSKLSGELIGVGLIGVAFVAAYYSDQNLMESVEIYNGTLGKKKKSSAGFNLQPTLGVLPVLSLHTTSFVPSAGVSISY